MDHNNNWTYQYLKYLINTCAEKLLQITSSPISSLFTLYLILENILTHCPKWRFKGLINPYTVFKTIIPNAGLSHTLLMTNLTNIK